MQALLSILAFILPQALALYPAHHPPNCSTFAHDIDFTPYNATFLNATLYPPRTLNTSNTLNNYTFCEIYAAINYSPNARLVFALWLPEPSQYQNRFLALGNGGYAGTIYYTDMMRQLNSGMGFAVASGNAGHSAYEETDGNNFGAPNEYIPFLHDDVSVEAWIHDAVSLFTPLARKLTEAYYARAPRYMYYSGCSTGGAQGFALAQYHPELFDGIFAGSPALSYTGVLFSFLWTAQHLSGPGRLSQAALNLTTNAVLDACDELDGVRDRMIENPLDCRFDIAKLTCGGTRDDSNDDQAQCLTPAQVQAAKAVYAGPSTSDTGEQIYPGFPLGSENQWYQIQESGGAANYTVPAFQNAVYDDLDWDPSSFNWTSAKVQHVMARLGPLIDQTSTNLTAFRLRSGKMLTTQGWVCIESRTTHEDLLTQLSRPINTYPPRIPSSICKNFKTPCP